MNTDARAEVEDAGRSSDEELVARLASGETDALRTLHRRYASLVFTVASRIVDPTAAEEVVQDVFVVLWKKHETFDSTRGTFRGWITQIAKRCALNRRRGASWQMAEREEALADLPDQGIPADEAQWLAHRRSVLRAAVDALPTPQRQAVTLAFFEELTHEQIATLLKTPVGTTKTRIRLALKRLGPALAILLAGALLVFVWQSEGRRRARDENALWMVTASDVIPLRLTAAAGVPEAAHGTYRARGGVAVLTTSRLPSPPAGQRYVGWIRHGTRWHSLGPVDVRTSDGRSLTLAELGEEAEAPDELRVTRDSKASSFPEGPIVLQWLRLASP